MLRLPTPEKPIVVKDENLGSGFRRVGLEEFSGGGIEGIYHGEYLFYLDRKLGEFSSSSVAPSRKFAIYFDLTSDRLTLFRTADQTVIQLMAEPVDDFGGFEWYEAEGYVVLRLSRGQETRKFSLK